MRFQQNSDDNSARVFSPDSAAIAMRALKSALCCFLFSPTFHASLDRSVGTNGWMEAHRGDGRASRTFGKTITEPFDSAIKAVGSEGWPPDLGDGQRFRGGLFYSGLNMQNRGARAARITPRRSKSRTGHLVGQLVLYQRDCPDLLHDATTVIPHIIRSYIIIIAGPGQFHIRTQIFLNSVKYRLVT
jgi:hypothetical protein